MTEPPEGYYICPSCGTEFGNDDTLYSHEELRAAWEARGARWFSQATIQPEGWNPILQLIQAGFVKYEYPDAPVRTVRNLAEQLTVRHSNLIDMVRLVPA